MDKRKGKRIERQKRGGVGEIKRNKEIKKKELNKIFETLAGTQHEFHFITVVLIYDAREQGQND